MARNTNKKKFGIVKDFRFWKKMNQLATVWVGLYILYVKQWHFVSCKKTSLYPLSKKKIKNTIMYETNVYYGFNITNIQVTCFIYFRFKYTIEHVLNGKIQ